MTTEKTASPPTIVQYLSPKLMRCSFCGQTDRDGYYASFCSDALICTSCLDALNVRRPTIEPGAAPAPPPELPKSPRIKPHSHAPARLHRPRKTPRPAKPRDPERPQTLEEVLLHWDDDETEQVKQPAVQQELPLPAGQPRKCEPGECDGCCVYSICDLPERT